MGDGDQERRGEDPFEDLDSFFAPIEGVQWPEDERRHDAPVASEGGPPVERPQPAPEPDPGDRAVVLPEAGPEPSMTPVGAEDGDPLGTREMSGEEWRRLRNVLGDDAVKGLAPPADEPLVVLDDGEEFAIERDLATVPDEHGWSTTSAAAVGGSYGSGAGPDRPPRRQTASGEQEDPAGEPRPVPPSPPVRPSAPLDPPSDDLTAAWPDPQIDDEPGDLTLDDLKKAPPEYANLPGPRDPASAGPRTRSDVPAPGSPATPPGGTHVQVVGGSTGAEPPPSLAEVEAMAENLAMEFRSSPTDDVPEPVEADTRAHRSPELERPPTTGPTAGAPAPPPFDDDLVGEFEAPEPREPPSPKRAPRTVKVGAPEDLTGPSWEDPTARTVTRERAASPRRGGERDLPMAVITGAALIALALLALAFKPFAFAVVAALVIVVAQAEFYAATQRQGYHPATLLGLAAGVMVVAGAYYRGEAGILAMVILTLVATFLWFMATPARSRTDVIANAGVTMFGLLYVPVLGSFYVLLLTYTDSRGLVLSVLGLTFLYDVAAFFIGRYWGRRPLAPTISPKKSWEGLGGATVVTVLVASVLPRSFGPLTSEWKLVELGLVIVLFAPIGDLVESMLKRDLGIKDMGSILPGHGGMLDRIDSALLVGPAVFYLLRLIG